jgi:hypothetical protein
MNSSEQPNESSELDISSLKWQDLESRWNAIVGMEAAIESMRMTLEGVRSELETAWKQTLTPEEKLHALRADVAQWNKAKTRVHYALPKVREFCHRATWAMGVPERKKLEELFKEESEVAVPPPDVDLNRVADQLHSLLKDRQVLSGQGQAVYHECKTISGDIQSALRTLKSNAAVAARQKRDANRAGMKFFKDVRRLAMGRPRGPGPGPK